VTPTRQGSFHLFRVAGISLYLHWSWFVVGAYEINARAGRYSSPAWNVIEYLALFLIVLLHEFGHALACRQVGGKADQIVLWPLGGVAYVDPPQRPGATLWSIAAGPLVNVALVPVFTVLLMLGKSTGWGGANPNLLSLVQTLWTINVALLVFNLLPVYPLDGGQILRSLLWYVVGPARSLLIAAMIGFVGVAALLAFAVVARSVWLGILAVFILLNCMGGLLRARALARLAELPRREGFACPSCQARPIRGNVWMCAKCRIAFDAFETQATCPQCRGSFETTRCPDCGKSAPLSEWVVASPG
jgi:Zn-dependent protease